MTPPTIAAGWIILGFSLLTFGAVVIAAIRSELAEVRASRSETLASIEELNAVLDRMVEAEAQRRRTEIRVVRSNPSEWADIARAISDGPTA